MNDDRLIGFIPGVLLLYRLAVFLYKCVSLFTVAAGL